MRFAFVLVVMIGIVIGLAVPMRRPQAPIVAVAEARHDDPPEETVIRPNSNGHFITYAKVDGEPTRFVIDTGADMVALTMEDARRANIPFDPSRFGVVARGASGDVFGQKVVIDVLSLDGKAVRDVHAAVLRDLDISLLGQSYLRNLQSVQMNGDEMRLR